MSTVTKEKLEEIFKVYDEQRNGAIKTIEIGRVVVMQVDWPPRRHAHPLGAAVPQRGRHRGAEAQGGPRPPGQLRHAQVRGGGAALRGQAGGHQPRGGALQGLHLLRRGYVCAKADESGTITEAELRKIMASFNKPLAEDEVKEILKYAKVKDGRIHYKDFIKTILTGKFE